MGIACSKAGDAITFKLAACEIGLVPQSGLDSVHFENTGSGASRAITASIDVDSFTYTEGTSPLCKNPGTTHEDGGIAGSLVLKGYEYLEEGKLGNQQGFWVQ